MLNLSSLKHHMWIPEESVGLIRAPLLNTQEDLANISKHLGLFFILWCSWREAERQKDGKQLILPVVRVG